MADTATNNATTDTADASHSVLTRRQRAVQNGLAYKAVKDTAVNWTYQGYGILTGRNYDTYRDALLAQMTTLIQADNDGKSTFTDIDSQKKSADDLVKQAEKVPFPGNDGTNGATGEVIGNRYLYRSPSVSDAAVGGNDAINPYSAFNLDDDLIHDLHYTNGQVWGMGRCYGEIYESKQQILYLTMGIPKFRNLQKWLENATHKELAEMNDMGSISLLSKLGTLIKGGISLAIQLPWLPLKWAANIINGVKDFKVTEYFYFRDDMPLYYRYVNSILSEIAVGMGLYGNGGTEGATEKTDDNTKGQPNNGSNISQAQLDKYAQNLPAIMENGPDIFAIMCRRAQRLSSSVRTTRSTDELIKKMHNKYTKAYSLDNSTTIWDSFRNGLRNFWTGMETGALEGMNFVGFRIEKSDNANESFSNSTENSPLLNVLNNEVAKKREQNLGALAQGTGAMATGVNALKTAQRIANNVKNFTQNVSNFFTSGDAVDQTIAYMASGNGFFDLPKQWCGSNMSRSISFNMKLRARTGGDNVSIFQSIMIPLSCILAAALPRGVGDSTYTSPFIIRAFCKGMFAVPAGIINTLSITRGSSEFGWSLSKLPTVVDVSFTIEDLSPILFLSIAGKGQGELDFVMQAFGNNTKMHEYINTLVGIGAKERYYLLGQLKRRLQTAMLIGKNTVFSATYRGYVMGDSSIIRSLMAVTPWTRVPSN